MFCYYALSGKSTLLHTIILSACLHYHPNDLEIWLIDYKQTEFYLYKKKTPPHIKLIGVSKTPDFTFSLLDKIENEANQRTELMNRFDSQNLEEYRKHKGEPGYVNIPRLLIVIDEFHEMSQFVSTEMEYKDTVKHDGPPSFRKGNQQIFLWGEADPEHTILNFQCPLLHNAL